MKNTRPGLRPKLFSLLAALCLCAAAAAARPAKEPAPTPAQRAEAARLRRALEAAVGEHFEVTRGRRAGGYWLAHLRAKRPGEFSVRYKYRYKDNFRPQDPLYTFVEHETHVVVGPKGCARRPRYNSVCVGDTVILPVVVDDHTGHTFGLASRPYQPRAETFGGRWREAEEAGLYREPVPNPAAEFLKYVGSRAHFSPHRSPGYTLEFYATFEAVRPCSFNLALGVTQPAAPPTAVAEVAAAAVPVVIVERGAPVTVLSATESVHGYTERFSSRSGNNYPTTPHVLQPGDRLTLRYMSHSVRGRGTGAGTRAALEGSVREHLPAVTLLPFRVDPAEVFNGWLVEFLPPPRRRE